VSLVTVSGQHTSVPRWAPDPPEVDLTGTSFLVLSHGEAGEAVAADWAATIARARKPLWVRPGGCAEGGALTLLTAQLECARVGTRVMVAAPELAVLDVLRVARAAGAIDAELRAFVTSDAARRVQCPHCAEHTIATVAVGETVACGGCGRTLVVYHHVSRRYGAYLGYMVDAECATAG
jgi:hypothetical protein